MESRKLEIVLHSAKDLHNRKHCGTMDPYATVWFAGGGMISEKLKTSVAQNAGSCPVWEYPMEFETVPIKNDYVLFCEIHHNGFLDRKIGEIQVPFTDLLAGDGSREKVSYPVKLPSGEVMGLIVISHKFSDPVVIPSKDSSTPEAKNKDNNNTGTSGDKVESNKKNDSSRTSKDEGQTPAKNVTGKKKRGITKRIAKRLGKEVVAKAVLAVGTVADVFALEGNLADEEVKDEDEEDEDGNEGQVDEEEDVDGDDDEYAN